MSTQYKTSECIFFSFFEGNTVLQSALAGISFKQVYEQYDILICLRSVKLQDIVCK